MIKEKFEPTIPLVRDFIDEKKKLSDFTTDEIYGFVKLNQRFNLHGRSFASSHVLSTKPIQIFGKAENHVILLLDFSHALWNDLVEQVRERKNVSQIPRW